jgi:hypothetical protein
MSNTMFDTVLRIAGAVLVYIAMVLAIHCSTYPGLLPWNDRLRNRVMDINVFILVGVMVFGMFAIGIALVIGV